MRAFIIKGPSEAEVYDVEPPVAQAGQVLVDVERVGVCGTDVELFTGEMSYLHTGHAGYPLRIGHEWCGRVAAVGSGVDPGWVGPRIPGDTMLGCGHCRRCLAGRQHVCENRYELGIRGGMAGALAEQLVVPASSLHRLPDAVDASLGALVEPGGNALRAVRAAGLTAGERLLVLGPGTIGLLVAQFGRARGIEVHLLGLPDAATAFARTLGFAGVWTAADLPTAADLGFDAVIDASTAPGLPELALRRVEPGRTIVYIGLAGTPSRIDTRELVLKDVTAVGILGASQGLAGAIEHYAAGDVDPGPLVAATVGLSQVADVLAGRPVTGPTWGPGPKVQVDPRIGVRAP
jgi:threonine dehydrogenase-like Zn-dependent dehydrogenase